MRFFSILVASLVTSLTATASSKYEFKKYWVHKTLKSKTTTMQVYTKNSPLTYLKGLGTITISENNKDSVDSVLYILKGALGKENWTTDKIDGLDVYEKFDTGSMALYRLVHNTKTNQYSIGSIKTRFLMPSYIEMHLLQVEALTNKKSKTTASFLYNLIFLKAVAADAVNPFDYVNTLNNTVTQIGKLNTGLDNHADAMRDLSGSLDTTNVTIGNSTTQLQNTAAQLGNDTRATAATLQQSTDQVGKDLKDTAKTLQDSTAQVGDDLKNTGKQFGDDMKETISPENAAKIAAAAALSANLTNTLYHFFTTGTYTLARKAYYEAAGEFTPEEKKLRIQDFEDSLKQFVELSPEVEKLDQRLSLAAASLSSLTKGNPTEITLAEIDRDIARIRKSLTEGASICETCLSDAALKIGQLEEMKKVIKASGVDVEKKKGEICGELDRLFLSWRDTELNLANARASIIQNAEVFMGLVSETASVQTAWQEKRKQKSACEEPDEDKIENYSYEEIEFCRKNPYSPRASCVTIRAVKLKQNSCRVASQAKVTENLKARLEMSSARMNSSIGAFSQTLGTLDCEAEDKNGNCVAPGVYAKASESFQKRFEGFANQCPGRGFTNTIKYEQAYDKQAEVEAKKPEKVPWYKKMVGIKPKKVATGQSALAAKNQAFRAVSQAGGEAVQDAYTGQ